MNGTRHPILVTGAHRSGTGWVGQVLTCSATPVGYIWEPFSPKRRPGILAVQFPYWFPYICDENGTLYEAAIQEMLEWHYQTVDELKAIRAPKDVARMARDRWQFAKFRRRGAVPLLKDPIAVFSAEWLARRFGMQVVVLIRHPAAFAASLKRLGWTHPFNDFLEQPLLMRDHLGPYADQIREYAQNGRDVVDQAILLWLLIYDAVLRFKESHPDWAFVRLEDLSSDPLPHFRELFGDIGLPFTERAERFIEETTDVSNPAEAGRPDSVRRHSAAHVSNWKRTLTDDEVARVRMRTSAVADKFYGPGTW